MNSLSSMKYFIILLLLNIYSLNSQAQKLIPDYYQLSSINHQILRNISSYPGKHPQAISPLSDAFTKNDSSVVDVDIRNSDVWLATATGAAYSSNFGLSWLHFDSTKGLGSGGVSGLSTSSALVSVSTVFLGGDSNFSILTGSGVSFAADNGVTWSHVPQPTDFPSDSIIAYGINDSLWILPILVPEQNVTYDISQSNNAVWIASWAGGLRSSTDQGQHWQRTLLPLDNMVSIKPTDTLWTYSPHDSLHQRRIFKRFDPRINNNLLAFSVAIENDTTFWCGTAGGINKSTNRGLGWVRYTTQNTGMASNWTIALHHQETAHKQILWASTWPASDPNERYAISFTRDSGTNWERALLDRKCFNISSFDDTVYVSAENGLFRSVDGIHWESFDSTAGMTIYDAVKDT
ncbi:MAG: hypothetical protein HYZ34_01070, partial [Ignavibacteriae bacterium]|nr:hypothetical protein [Ignavibacteriota bacterium]